MINNKMLFFLFLLLLLLSCNDSKGIINILEYEDGSKWSWQKINAQTVEHKIYYPNGDIQEIYFTNSDNIRNGESKTYFLGKKIESVGLWENGYKKGEFKYFDSKGFQFKSIFYTNKMGVSHTNKMGDSLSFPNQIIHFNQTGDTVKGKPSLYYKLSKPDTIIDGSEYEFEITLIGKRFSNMHIAFCKFDKDDKDLNCRSFDLGDDSTITMIKTKYKQGINYINGVFVNYEIYENNGKESLKSIEVDFLDSFFVKP